MKTQANRNANELITRLRYAILANDVSLQCELIDKSRNVNWEIVNEETTKEWKDLELNTN